MKQLPHVSAALYGMPWSILPQHHAELGALYRSYLKGELPVADTLATPKDLAESGEAGYGISFVANHAEGIAVVSLSGVITKRAPAMFCGPPLIDLARLDAVLDDIAADSLIQTVIFDIDSPGGMVIGLQETSDRIRELANLHGKRIIFYTDLQMCSAAYYLAAAADEVYAAPSAVIGSIGTYCAGLDDSREWEMEGLELILAKSGDLKAMGHPGKKWSDEEKKWLQDKADQCGAEFRGWVTVRRPQIDAATMQGQWFFAKDAPVLVDGYYRDLPALLADVMRTV